MKNKLLKYLFAVGTFVVSIIGMTQVSALTNNLTQVNSPYFYNRDSSSMGYASWYWKEYSFGNRVAYCIEPSVPEGTSYNVGDWSNTGLSNDIKERIYLLAYYGYEYPGHQTLKYKAATQALIWETILGSDSHVGFSTQRYSAGSTWDVTSERNDINNLIANHYNKPSFNGQTISGNVGETITINDNNGVLSNYNVIASNDADVSISGNTLTIRPTKVGNIQLRFTKKLYTTEEPVIFYGDGIQNMIVGGAVDPVVSVINVKSIGGVVDFSKLDKDNKNDIPQGEATFKGAIYGIYDAETDAFISKAVIDEKGTAHSEPLPYLGRFYLLEVKASEGYQLDTTKYYFDSTLDNINATLKVYEKVINRNFDFTKVYADAKTGFLKGEPNATFEFYNNKNELVKTIKSDNSGRFVVNMPYGTYRVHQATSTLNYEKVEDFTIEVKEMGDTIYHVISNAEIQAKLKLVKVDKDSNKILVRDGIKFKIKNLDTGEYVCQNITYPAPNKVCVYETKDGMFVTPHMLKSGNYQIEEQEDQTIEGYIWNKEPLKFSIDENSEFIVDKDFGIMLEVKFQNQQVKGEVEINKVGEQIVFENNSFRYEEIKLDGVSFELYADGDIISQDGTLIYKDKELIKSFKTVDGFYKLTDLYLGNYCLKETSTVLGHVLDSKNHCFSIKYKDQYTDIVSLTLNLKNYLPKGTLDFTKTDLISGEGIPNTYIEIYSDNEETGESKLIFSGYTDSQGKIKIEKLFVGKGHIIEKESADGYQITDEIVYFEIKEDGEIVKANMKNEKIVEVPNTLKNDYCSYIAGSLIIVGIGLVGYALFKNKKKKK
ncbi:MAG: SpaA isopeptide-forming pilin-related protein [bacterium]|nr:SpaA isopeptide-forming pilin-related protein [bacterium]